MAYLKAGQECKIQEITLGKGREVPELCSQEAECWRACSHVSCVVLAFWREKAHGMPFEAIPLAPSHAVWSEKGSRVATFLAKKEGVWRDLSEKRCRLVDFQRKRKVCGAISERKVPTRRFSAKKETVWRDLPAICHNSAKKEGGWHNLSREKCRLADFQQKRKPCGATSKSAKYSLFLCVPAQIK